MIDWIEDVVALAIEREITEEPPTSDAVHNLINWARRRFLLELTPPELANKTRVLYGGSVKPDNAKGLLGCEDIDGALVGGASLKADSFAAIVKAAPRA